MRAVTRVLTFRLMKGLHCQRHYSGLNAQTCSETTAEPLAVQDFSRAETYSCDDSASRFMLHSAFKETGCCMDYAAAAGGSMSAQRATRVLCPTSLQASASIHTRCCETGLSRDLCTLRCVLELQQWKTGTFLYPPTQKHLRTTSASLGQ